MSRDHRPIGKRYVPRHVRRDTRSGSDGQIVVWSLRGGAVAAGAAALIVTGRTGAIVVAVAATVCVVGVGLAVLTRAVLAHRSRPR